MGRLGRRWKEEGVNGGTKKGRKEGGKEERKEGRRDRVSDSACLHGLGSK